MEWQPIETAPKTATEVLLYCEGEMFVGWWHKPDKAYVWIMPNRTIGDDAYILGII